VSKQQDMYLEYHTFLCDKARALSKNKQNDYTTHNVSDDPMVVFQNYMNPEKLGISSTETTLLSRLCDKYSRLINIATSGTCSVSDETIDDTVLDMLNILVILSYYIKLKRG